MMSQIYVDADGCPVKDEVYRVAARYRIKVLLVANQRMKTPNDDSVQMVVVSGAFDAAADWIVEHVQAGDIVITADILLAQRCLSKKANVLGPKGIEFSEDNIGEAVANRELMENLRHMGERGGPAPMEKRDRSNFLGKLDQIIQRLRRQSRPQA